MVGTWNMKKKILTFLSAFYFLVVGYTYPDGSPYVVIDCALGSDTVMYLPSDKMEYLSITDSAIINTSSSTVYCYIGTYKIYFPTYEEPYYYTGSSYSSSSVDLDITAVSEVVYDTDGSFVFKENSGIVTVSILGGCLLCLLMLTTRRS